MTDEVEKQAPAPPKKKGLHYGYFVCVAGFLTQSLLLTGQRSLSLGLVDISKGIGVTVGEAGALSAWYGLIYAGAGFFWGWLSDVIGPRKALTMAGGCVAIGLILFGILGQNGLPYALLTWSIVGLGAAGLFVATVPKLVAAWFTPDKRGHAMRFVTPGGGLTSMVLGTVFPLLVNATSWQTTYIILGCYAAVISIFFFVMMRDSPYEMGLTPIGSPPDAVPTPPVVNKSVMNFVDVLKLPMTWHFGIMYIIYIVAYSANSTYYAASMQVAGYTRLESGLGVSIASLVAVLCMQIWGPLSDRFERKTVIMMGCVGYAVVAFCYFMLLRGPIALWVCYVFVSLMQGLFGVNTVVLAALGDYFPAKFRGTANGVVSTMSMVGRYGGPVISGAFIDANGGNVGYGIGFTSIAAVIAAVAVMTLPNLKKGAKARGAEK